MQFELFGCRVTVGVERVSQLEPFKWNIKRRRRFAKQIVLRSQIDSMSTDKIQLIKACRALAYERGYFGKPNSGPMWEMANLNSEPRFGLRDAKELVELMFDGFGDNVHVR